MTSNNLLEFALQENINTYDRKLPTKKAFSVENNIVIDKDKVENEREYKKILSEEIGHCISGSFYTLEKYDDSLKRTNILKAEKKATDISYSLLVPLKDLKSALKTSNDEYELCDILDVDIDTLSGAVKYYQEKGLLNL